MEKDLILQSYKYSFLELTKHFCHFSKFTNIPRVSQQTI